MLNAIRNTGPVWSCTTFSAYHGKGIENATQAQRLSFLEDYSQARKLLSLTVRHDRHFVGMLAEAGDEIRGPACGCHQFGIRKRCTLSIPISVTFEAPSIYCTTANKTDLPGFAGESRNGKACHCGLLQANDYCPKGANVLGTCVLRCE